MEEKIEEIGNSDGQTVDTFPLFPISFPPPSHTSLSLAKRQKIEQEAKNELRKLSHNLDLPKLPYLERRRRRNEKLRRLEFDLMEEERERFDNEMI